MTSSVLAGFNMQYKTSDYTQRINKAFETTLEEIANIKYLVRHLCKLIVRDDKHVPGMLMHASMRTAAEQLLFLLHYFRMIAVVVYYRCFVLNNYPQVITGENRRVKAKQELDATEEHKQERTAKFHNFEMQYQRTR